MPDWHLFTGADDLYTSLVVIPQAFHPTEKLQNYKVLGVVPGAPRWFFSSSDGWPWFGLLNWSDGWDCFWFCEAMP